MEINLTGIGKIIINSKSKIKKIIEIIKNWFEKLNFIFEFESNPHSTFDFDNLLVKYFCSNEEFRRIRIDTITNEIIILIGILIIVIEKFLYFIVSR